MTKPIRVRTKYLPRLLELPIFEGVDLDSWIFRVERYFEINGLHADERLQAAMVCMKGEVLAWCT